VITLIFNFADAGVATTLATPRSSTASGIMRGAQRSAKDDMPRQMTEAESEENKQSGGE
jgi:hypothetical protein